MKRRHTLGHQAIGWARQRHLLLEACEPRLVLAGVPELIELHSTGASHPADFVRVGELTFFTATDGTNGRELWKTDGTPQGTLLVKDILPGSGSSEPNDLVAFQGNLYFAADDGANGRELWRSDGTAEGTVMVRDINPGEGYQYPYGEGNLSSFPGGMVVFDNRLWLVAEDSDTGTEIWNSDGTTAGTTLVKDLATGSNSTTYGTYPNSSYPQELTVVNGTLFFSADDRVNGRELWKSDGTAEGTVMVKDIFTGTYPYYYDGESYGDYPNQSRPTQLTAVNGVLFFAATDEEHGTELWKSDGTAAGTVLVKDINAGAPSGLSSDNSLIEFEGRLLFAAATIDQGKELWSSDGTEAGTSIVKDIRSGSAGGIAAAYLTQLDGQVFFAADDGATGTELWKTDGTESGTVLVSNLDGSASGSFPRYLTVADGRLYFSAFTASDGRELWESDGTAAGTAIVADLAAGTASSTPRELFAFDQQLLFSADNGTNGRELYAMQTDDETVPGDLVVLPDTYQVAEDNVLTVGASEGVLANDGNGQSGQLTATLVNQPTNGTLTLNSDGSFVYTPTANFFGTDSFAYRASDGTVQSSSVSVTLTVTSVDDVPTAVADSYTVNEDSVLNVTAAQGVLANDIDPDGNVTVSVMQAPTNGSLTLNADGSFVYTPNANFTGTDSFTYSASDGANQTIAAATITVVDQPDPPTASNDAFTITNNGTSQVLNVLANDTFSPDVNDSLTVVSVTQGSQGGTVTLTDGQVSYRPASGFAGTETFQYTIEDTDDLTRTATVTVTVTGSEETGSRISGLVYLDQNGNGQRDANELGVPGALITLTGTATAGGAVERTRMSGDDGSYVFDNLPAGTYAVVERQPTALIDGTESSGASGANTGTNDRIGNLVVNGQQTLAANNFAERQLQSAYTSIAWFFASATSSSGVFRESMAQAEESVGETELAEAIRNGGPTPPVETNRAPVATADSYSTQQGTALNVTVANGVLANDTDPDGDTITAALVTNVSNGTLTLNANGSFTYTPTAGATGTDSFTYRASDGSLFSNTVQVTINLTSVSGTSPVAVADTYTVLHNTTLTIDAASGLLGNDTDADGDTLTANRVTSPTNGTLTLNANGSFVYIPNTGFSGTDSFTYQASDGSRTSSITTVTLNVRAANTAPVPSNDIYFASRNTTLTVNAAAGVLVNDSDAQGDSLTAAVIETTSNGTLTLNSNGSFTYVPNAGFVGSDTFTYRASDGSLSSNAATVTINVSGANTAPVATNDAYAVDEGGTLNVTAAAGLLANDLDNELADMTAQLISGPANGTLNLSPNGSFTYTPDSGFSGTDSFTYQAHDGLASSNTATVTITVNGVNDLPQAVNDEFTVVQGNELDVTAAMGVLANDTDANDDNLTANLITPAANGTLTLNADGSFQYVPNVGFMGTDSFTYQAHDGEGSSNTATVTVHVTPLNVFSLLENTAAGTLVGQLQLTDPSLNGQVTFQFDDDQLPAALRLVPDDHRAGSPTATVVLIKYLDFQSSSSRAYHSVVEQLQTEFAGQLLVVRRHFPLIDANDNALVAAIASEAAGLQGKFDEMADLLFEHQEDWATEADPQPWFEGYAAQLGLDVPQFIEDLSDEALTARVQRDRDAAIQLGATTTPTIYLQGEPLNELPASYNEFRDLVQVELDQVDDVFRLNRVTGQILVRDSAALDFETNPSFQLHVRVIDLDGDTEVIQAIINLVDAGEVPPVANPDSYTLAENSVLTASGINGVLANDVDEDGDLLRAHAETTVAHGTLTLLLNGSFVYTPNENFYGVDSFTYRVSDGLFTSDATTVTLNVTPLNDAPQAADDAYTVEANTVLAVEAALGVLANDTDPDDDLLIAQLVSPPSHGTLLLAADGTIHYTPDDDFTGTDTFTYQVSDGVVESNIATVTITVTSAEPTEPDEESTEPDDESTELDDESTDLDENSTAGEVLSAPLIDEIMADW